jgi:hypothetical protein
MHVYGAAICGKRKEETQFVGTGVAKGSYPLFVCDKEPHTSGGHHDSHYGTSWN